MVALMGEEQSHTGLADRLDRGVTEERSQGLFLISGLHNCRDGGFLLQGNTRRS